MPPHEHLTDLGRVFSDDEYRRLMQIVYEAVQDGMAPWEPGRIGIYRSDDGSGFPEIAIRIERFPNLTFKTNLDFYLPDPKSMVLSAAEKAYKFYRYRKALPVEDHIILGED